MHGSPGTAGLEPANPGGEDDSRERGLRDALRLFQEAAAAACTLGEHKLQREAEDAAARLFAQIRQEIEAAETRERLRSS